MNETEFWGYVMPVAGLAYGIIFPSNHLGRFFACLGLIGVMMFCLAKQMS